MKQKEIKEHNKIAKLVRSKLSSIDNTTSKALKDNEISHEDFTTIIIKKRNYRQLKESQRCDTDKNNLINEGKIISIDKIIEHN